MTDHRLLNELYLKWVDVWAEGEQLCYRGPQSSLQPELLEALARSKPALVEMLRSEAPGRETAQRLTPGQFGLYLLHARTASPASFNVQFAARIQGQRFDVAAAQGAFEELVARHAALRMRCVIHRGMPWQTIEDRIALQFEEHHLDEAGRSDVAGRVRTALQRPFDLTGDRLFRVHLFHCGADDYVLALAVHHIVCDLWSLSILIRELGELYAAKTRQQARLSEPPAGYEAFARWQAEMLAGPEGRRHAAWWKAHLDRDPASHAPLFDPRSDTRREGGDVCRLSLPPSTTGAVSRLARERGVTLNTVVLAALQAHLYLHTGRSSFYVAVPAAGRTSSAFVRTVGHLVNTLPVRADVSPDESFASLVQRTDEHLLEALDHQDYPFPLAVAQLEAPRTGRMPVAQVAAAFEEDALPGVPGLTAFLLDRREHRLTLGGLELSSLGLSQQENTFDLALLLTRASDRFVGWWQYARDVFDEPAIARHSAAFATLLAAAVTDPDRQVGALPVLSVAESHAVTIEVNDTAPPASPDRSVTALVDEQIARRPDAVAIVEQDTHLSYGELRRRSGDIERAMRTRIAPSPGAFVGLLLERGASMVCAMTAALRLGAAYVPLDPGHPAERLQLVAADAGLCALVADGHVPRTLAYLPVIQIASARGTERPLRAPRPPAVDAESPAYVIYTSGSTGQPKGVVVPHRAIVRLVREQAYAPLDADSRIAQASNNAFDAATFEIWGALANGGRLIVVSREVQIDVERLHRLFDEQNVDTLFLTTALFSEIVRERPRAFSGLRQLLFGGEAVEMRIVRAALAHGGMDRLVHVYGPTENTTFSSWHRLRSQVDVASAPIGRAIGGSTAYVVTSLLQPAAIDQRGELLVGGAGLAHGYHRQSDRTAEAFIPDPLGEEPGARLYRTGDMVSWDRNGSLVFHGRRDHQVKIRGFRIELEEVTAAVLRHPEIREAIVVARPAPTGGQQLVCYWAAATGGGPSRTEIAHFIRSALPEYAVPEHFVRLDRLPLNANGKIDRTQLPPPSVGRPAAGPGPAVWRTPTERRLASLWEELLEVPVSGAHEDFFLDLGGHSMLAMQLVFRLRAVFAVGVPADWAFESPTIAGMASRLDALIDASNPV